MICDYDAEQQLLLLTFVVVAGEENVANWGWFIDCVKRWSVLIKLRLSQINI
jgi:hypothetical protein